MKRFNIIPSSPKMRRAVLLIGSTAVLIFIAAGGTSSGFWNLPQRSSEKLIFLTKYINSNENDPSQISVPIEDVMSGEPVKLSQDDERIKKYILDNGYLIPPSTEAYNLQKPGENPSMGQGQMIGKIFNNKTGGFFVECGALDGELRSNTLTLEKDFGWKGLLIEADPKNFALVQKKNRKAWTSNTCLATKPQPHKVVFRQLFNLGFIHDNSLSNSTNVKNPGFAVVQCFPIFSILNAMGVKEVDYFSLDVEGVEMEVLKNIPWDKLVIKTLSIEFSHVNVGQNALKSLMEGKGYVSVGTVINSEGLANDFIFVHQSFTELIQRGLKG